MTHYFPTRRSADLRQADLVRTRLLVVEDYLVLRLVRQAVRTHEAQAGLLGRHAEQLVARAHQGFLANATLVLQIEVEAGGVAEFQDRGRHDREPPCVLDRPKSAKSPPGQRLRATSRASAERTSAEYGRAGAGSLGLRGRRYHKTTN